MESRTKLNNYIKSLAEQKVITITQLDWTKQYGLELYDYLIELQIGIYKTSGRGTAENETEAIQIAFGESIERLIIKEHNIANSSGCAVHIDQERALINARNELIERDCFLNYFYFGSNLKKCHIDEKNNLTLFFKKLNLNYRNYILYSSDIHINLCVIFDKIGLVLGLGANSNKEQSIYKAMVESIRQYLHIIHFGNKKDISLDEFASKKGHTFNDHGNLLFNREYLSKISIKFKTKKTLKYHYRKDGFMPVEYRSIALPDVPLVFIKISNENLQSLYLGLPDNKINQKRIAEFGIFQNCSYVNLPHPLR